MRTTFIALVALSLLSPFVLAHIPPGPKNFCENSPDWSTHDYNVVPGPSQKNVQGQPGGAYFIYLDTYPVQREWIAGPFDGNLLGNCSGGGGLPGEYDGHKEFATNGAYLAADNGGVYASGPWAGSSWGSQACLGENADHTPETPITIMDAASGGAVGMDIGADYARTSVPAYQDPITGGSWICGDHVLEPCGESGINGVTCNEMDNAIRCWPNAVGTPSNSCTPGFAPGQDGAYLVFAFSTADPSHPGVATAGHVIN